MDTAGEAPESAGGADAPVSGIAGWATPAIDHGGPVVSAVVLATASILPVAWSLALEPRNAVDAGWRQPAAWQALVIAASAVIVSALTAGWLGGFVRRRKSVTGVAVALFVAWPVAIAMLPVAGRLVDATVRYGVVCIDACSSPMLTEQEPVSGIVAWGGGIATSLILSLLGGEAYLLAVALLAVASIVAAKRRRSFIAVLLGVVVYAALHVLFFVAEPVALVAFSCLALGAIAWWWWLGERDRLLTAGAPNEVHRHRGRRAERSEVVRRSRPEDGR